MAETLNITSISKSEQSRLNGAKSKGPKTAEGKQRSSQNALKHGRYATNAVVLKNEDPEAFEALAAVFVRRIQPIDQVEYRLARELASIEWRLTRVSAIDTCSLDHEMDIQAPAFATSGVDVSERTRMLNASRSLVDSSKHPAFLGRREGQLIRARQSALAVLRELRRHIPLADFTIEVVPYQPLDPEWALTNGPQTNLECGADPQVCAVPPGAASATGGAALQRAGSPGPASNLGSSLGAASVPAAAT